MTPQADDLQARARRRHAQIQRRRRDPRYRKVVGRLVAAGVLTANYPVTKHRDPIRVQDALWAGQVEPRILELLPALIIKKPSLFVDSANLPDDLGEAVAALKRSEIPRPFRGIPGTDQARWVPRVGHRGKLPSQAKSFRLTAEDVRLLRRLRDELGLSETDVVRRGLRALAARTYFDDGE